MAINSIKSFNDALSAVQRGETLIANKDGASFRKASFSEKVSIAFNRKVLNKDPNWLKTNEVNVAKTFSKILTNEKKGFSTDQAAQLSRTLRFAGLNDLAQHVLDQSAQFVPPKTRDEAVKRRNNAWAGLFGNTVKFPADFAEVKALLTQYTKDHKTGDVALVRALKQIDVARSHLASNHVGLEVRQDITKALEDFHRQVKGYSPDISQDYSKADLIELQKLGKGGFGTVSLVHLDGKHKVLKNNDDPSPIKLDQSTSNKKGEAVLLRSPEVAAAFLRASESDVVVVPSHYIVREKSGTSDKTHLVEVRDKEFRAWAREQLEKNKDNPGYSLDIIGEVQDLAPGQEVGKLLEPGSGLTEKAAKRIAEGFLDGLATLAKRGFVHGDIKPQNAFFDEDTGGLKFIDVGSLAKVSKKVGERPNTAFSTDRGTTPVFSVPTGADGVAGFSQDLYSTGVSLLFIANSSKTQPDQLEKVLEKLEEIKDSVTNKTISLQEGQARATQLVKNSFPITDSKIERAGVAALTSALTNGPQLDDLQNRDQYIKLLQDIKASL
jgi:serine/threonine protein kinase